MRRGEEGVVLLLALLVIVVLMVIVPQLRFASRIDAELARNRVQDLQMEKLAQAALLRGGAALVLDLEDDSSGGEGGADGAAGGAPGGTGGGMLPGGGSGSPGGTGDGGSLSGGDGAGGPEKGKRLDSLDETWANGELTFDLGDEAGFKTEIRITDEDAKLNLLLLSVEDETYRKEWRDRFIRLLDLLRDGQPGDMSGSDSSDLIERFEKWMRGERPNDELSIAPLATGDWHDLRDQPTYAPLTLGELALAGGIKPALMHGYAVGEDDDRKWLLGLSQVLTAWSNLELIEPKEDDGTGVTPPGSDPSADMNKPKDRAETPGMNNGRINVNTAPIVVLKCLFPDSEIPYSTWDAYEEFRRNKLKELKEKRENGSFDSELDIDEKEDPVAADEPTYPLESIDDLRRFEGFQADSGNMTPDRWNKLASLLTVQSNVFDVTVVIGTRDQPHRFYVARSIVWRQSHGSKQCLPIIGFERLTLSAVDLQEFAKKVEEWSDY